MKYLSILFLLFLLSFVEKSNGKIEDQGFGKPRKISGDAASERAQEYIRIAEDIAQLLDYSMDSLPHPPPIKGTIGPPSISPTTTRKPMVTRIALPPSTIAMPPSTKPTEEIPPTLTPPPQFPIPITTMSATAPNRTTVVIQFDAKTTVSVEIEDSKDSGSEIIEKEIDEGSEEEDEEEIDDHQFFGIRNVEKKKEINELRSDDIGNDIEDEKSKEELNDVKGIIQKKKTQTNMTLDYYITSPATTFPPSISVNDTIEESSIDFNHLFEKDEKREIPIIEEKIAKSTAKTEKTRKAETITTKIVPKTTITTSRPTTKAVTKITKSPHVHTKTCIHVKDLNKIDDITKIDRQKSKKDRIEVSVEVESGGEEEEDSEGEAKIEAVPDESPTGSDNGTVHRSVSRKIRNQKEIGNAWKKYEMNCDDEEDEKGETCKLWAASGLCSTHKPTMFLFCRRTCLCVGPK